MSNKIDTAEKMNKRLNESLENYKGEVNFILETLQNGHENTVSKYDLERMAKQVYYTLLDFQLVMVDYAEKIEQTEKCRQP